MEPNDEKTEQLDATPPATSDGRRSFDRRSGLLAAGGVIALLLVLLIGICIGSQRDDDDERFGHRGDRQGMPFRGGGGERGMGGERGGPGMGGGPGAMGGERGMGGDRGMGGGPMGGRGGGLGVVTEASSSSITIEPLMGDQETVTVELGDDVEVKRRGDDGPGDIEDAKASDIDEGDIVMVRPDRDAGSDDDDADDETKAITAGTVLIVRDGE